MLRTDWKRGENMIGGEKGEKVATEKGQAKGLSMKKKGKEIRKKREKEPV